MSKRRSTAQVARDRRRIADLYLQGVLQGDIAVMLGISQPTVSRDLAALQREWRQSALIDIDERKGQELARIDALERTYWDAWQRSCEQLETVVQRGAPGEEGSSKVTTSAVQRTVKGQVGDPRFLVGVQWCIEQRCKILGIHAPERHELSGEGGNYTLVIGGLDLANDI